MAQQPVADTRNPINWGDAHSVSPFCDDRKGNDIPWTTRQPPHPKKVNATPKAEPGNPANDPPDTEQHTSDTAPADFMPVELPTP